jgi:hypothetical protein
MSLLTKNVLDWNVPTDTYFAISFVHVPADICFLLFYSCCHLFYTGIFRREGLGLNRCCCCHEYNEQSVCEHSAGAVVIAFARQVVAVGTPSY